MRKAIFLDRDGVLCEDLHYIIHSDQIQIFDFALEAVRILKNAGYLTIVVSNQSAIARNMVTEDKVNKINEIIKDKTEVDVIYHCPHLPSENGENHLPYRIECECRKPKPGMILQAASKYHIDLKQSYMVGDRKSDILAGKNAGVKTILLMTGKGENEKKDCSFADGYYNNLLDFAHVIA